MFQKALVFQDDRERFQYMDNIPGERHSNRSFATKQSNETCQIVRLQTERSHTFTSRNGPECKCMPNVCHGLEELGSYDFVCLAIYEHGD